MKPFVLVSVLLTFGFCVAMGLEVLHGRFIAQAVFLAVFCTLGGMATARVERWLRR